MKWVVIIEKPALNGIAKDIRLVATKKTNYVLDAYLAVEQFKVFEESSEAIKFIQDKLDEE